MGIPSAADVALARAVWQEIAATREIPHGTHAGYALHRRRGEPQCPDCLAAKARYSREYRARQEAERREQARTATLKESREPMDEAKPEPEDRCKAGYAAVKRYYGDAPRIALTRVEKALLELVADHPPGALVQGRIDRIIDICKENQ